MGGFEPGGDLVLAEADELADLVVRNAAFGDEPADEALSDSEPVCQRDGRRDAMWG